MKVISLDENCGIKRIKELLAEVLGASASEEGQNCSVDCAAARRIDCSVAQVLIALKRACESRGGTFEMVNAGEDVKRLLTYAGIL